MLGELLPGQPLLIAEAFATAATMREANSLAVAVAFDSGNLVEVSRAYRERDPVLRIVIVADNDTTCPTRRYRCPTWGRSRPSRRRRRLAVWFYSLLSR